MTCCCKEMSSKITLQKIVFNESAESISVVLYQPADDLRNAALSQKAGSVVFCLQLGDNIMRHLDFGKRSLLMTLALSENLPSKLFAGCIETLVKRDSSFLKRW